MNTARIPMPGALRWRVMHPLLDADGSCTLIYDLERAAVLEVPEELRLYVAPALEAGDLDDDLLSWLLNEDLLSTESWAGWAGELDRGPLDSASWWSSWTIEARRMASLAHQEASFELVLDSRKVTQAAATFLTSSPLHVRLLCGTFPAPGATPVEQRAWTSATASLFLLPGMMDRMSVQCFLAGGARLSDLWSWAKRSGIRHLETVHADLSAPEDTLSSGQQMREYRQDLLAVCEEMASDLEARRIPVDYQPLTRMVRRLMGSEPRIEPVSEPGLDGEIGSPAWPDLWAGGGYFPAAAQAEASGAWQGAHALDPDLSPCRTCWARSLCNHSTRLAVPAGDDLREPSPERCPLWLAEAEAALRLYHRLAQCDPRDILRLLGDSARTPLDPLGRREDLRTPKQPF